MRKGRPGWHNEASDDDDLFCLRTVAPPHPLTQVLGELVRGAGSQSLCLRPFTASEVAHFLEQATAQTPASSLVTAIWQTTGGNPFFVTEVVHTLLQEGQVDQWENRNVATLPLPQRVRACAASPFRRQRQSR